VTKTCIWILKPKVHLSRIGAKEWQDQVP
jgi:hypothetical protein